MNRFFALQNNVALKFQEIQYGFIEGVENVLRRYEEGNDISWAVKKLWTLKKSYEQELLANADSAEKVREIEICFRCFDKEKPCTDCDGAE